MPRITENSRQDTVGEQTCIARQTRWQWPRVVTMPSNWHSSFCISSGRRNNHASVRLTDDGRTRLLLDSFILARMNFYRLQDKDEGTGGCILHRYGNRAKYRSSTHSVCSMGIRQPSPRSIHIQSHTPSREKPKHCFASLQTRISRSSHHMIGMD